MARDVIKGLTVEIGGDTTKLGKALEDVNKRSRDLSGELTEINRLLKLDPNNTELLAQKQKVLAKAVSTTAEKLETLQEAEKQVQKQFERGEVSEEQVRALQREIIATEKKLKSYEKAVEETGDAIEKLGKSSADAAQDLKKTKTGADDASNSLKDLADSSDKAGKAGKNLGSKMGALAKGGFSMVATAAAAAATAMAGGLIASAEASREYRTEMGKLETAFTTAGHSTEAATNTYKSLQGVLGETDQAVEAANHLAKLAGNEKELSTWTNIATGVYATFGSSLPIENLTEAANETAKVGTITGGLADALNWAGVNEEEFQAQLDACSGEQERQTLIMDTLNGLYTDAAEKYRETNAEVIRANEANEAWAAAMGDVGGAIEPLLTDVKLMGASLLSELAPGVKEVTGALRAMLGGDDEAAADLSEALSGTISQLLNKLTDIAPKVAEVGLSIVMTLITTLVQSLPSIVGVILDIALNAVGTLASYLPTLLPAVLNAAVELVNMLATEAIPTAVNAVTMVITNLAATLPTLLQTLVTQIPVMLENILATALPAVLTIVSELLPATFMSLIDTIVAFLPTLVEMLVSVVHIVVSELIPQVVTLVSDTIPMLLSVIGEALPMVLDAAITLLLAIVDAIPEIIPPLIEAVPDIIVALVDALAQAIPIILDAAFALLFGIVKAIPQIIPSLASAVPTLIIALVATLLKAIPQVLAAAFKLLFSIVLAIPKIVVEIVKLVPSLIAAIVVGLAKGVASVYKVGSDLVKGLWNGIKDMTGWITGKLKGFGDSVLGGIKNFFGIKSPSRVFKNEVGKMLALGLAEGIEDNADDPLKAMQRLSGDMLGEAESLNGLTLERRLQHTFAAPDSAATAQSGVLSKLDSILAAIERGQIITINGDKLVGATAGQMNSALGQRRVLAERGAI